MNCFNELTSNICTAIFQKRLVSLNLLGVAKKSLHITTPLKRRRVYKKPPGRNNMGYVLPILENKLSRVSDETLITDQQIGDFTEDLNMEVELRETQQWNAKCWKHKSKIPKDKVLTSNQEDHLRFLHQDDPIIWDIKSLAHAFQISKLNVKKILQIKYFVRLEDREKYDFEAKKYQMSLRTQGEAVFLLKDKENTGVNKNESAVVHNNKHKPNYIQTYNEFNNTWFMTRSANNNKMKPSNQVQSYTNNIKVEWIEENESEFYEHIYSYDKISKNSAEQHYNLSDEEIDERGDEFEDNSDSLHIITEDGKLFKDNNGIFLFKVP